MKKETFFILAIMIAWIGMLLRTFFWWTGENPEIKEESTWFIKEIVETWYNEDITGSSIEGTIDETQTWNSQINEYVEIRVMMPHYFYTQWRKNFAQDLYTEKKVYMNFTFIDNLNDYRDDITNEWFSDADLALIPYDRMEYINPKTFAFQKNVDTDFDKMVSSVINNSGISFLPLAVDPMIMYTLTGNKIQTNFADMLDFVYDYRIPVKSLAFPIFFWLTPEDWDNEWFIREYQDIVRYALMHYFATYRDANSLEKWLDTNLVWKNYKLSTLNTIMKKFSNQNCNNFPSICMQLDNYVTIRFWFLSDKDVVNQYFQEKKSEFNNISKDLPPFSSIETPFRLWWWIIPWTVEDENKLNGVYTFLAQYMKKHSSYQLWNSTLSAFAWSGSNLMENKFIWTRWYLLQWWGKFMNVIRNTKSFRQMIERSISARDYLKL